MKKNIKYLITSLFLLLLSMSHVNAKTVYDLDWKTEEIVLENQHTLFSDYGIRNVEFNGEYLTTFYADGYSYLISYDIDGNELNSTRMGQGYILEMIVKDDYLYIVVEIGESINLFKYNSSLEFENGIAFDYDDSIALGSMLHSEIPFFAINLLSIDDEGNAYLLTVDYDILAVKSDFSNYEYIPYDEELLNKQFPELAELENYQLDEYYYYNLKKNDKNTVLSGIKPNDCLFTSDECEYDSIGVVTLQDSEGTELWTKEYTEYKEFINTLLINDYIVTIGIKDLEDLAPCDIVVIDLEGNIVQTIENENSFYYLVQTTRGIMVANYREEANGGNDGTSNIDTVTFSTEVYQFRYDILTKIEGKGNVEVIESELPGKDITFKVTPEEGYVLEAVKVTDANGNVITFTDYTFTMPSSDVTIEVTFIKEEKNPETSDLIIISCLAIIVSGTILTYLNIKKRMITI